MRFSVDTGASNTILDGLTAAELGIKGTGEHPIVGAGKGEIKTKVAHNVALEIGGLRLRNLDVLITDLSSLASQGHSIDGILGYDLFSTVVVTIEHTRPLGETVVRYYTTTQKRERGWMPRRIFARL